MVQCTRLLLLVVTFFLLSSMQVCALLNSNNPLLNNPLSRLVSNAYSFFYWLPRKNLPYDHPWALFRNNSAEWVRWYQFPHNLPPYRFLDSGYPDDFFCWGLPGNTLPLGNWDPWGMQQVNRKVVRKYRESELKHGRLAMLATVSCALQESLPYEYKLYPPIGGLAITHMQQLADLPVNSCFFKDLLSPLALIGVDARGTVHCAEYSNYSHDCFVS